MSKKWSSPRLAAKLEEQSDGTTRAGSKPGGLMEDSAIAARASRENAANNTNTSSAAAAAPAAKVFSHIDAADALSNMFHSTTKYETYECGAVVYEPAATAEKIHEEIMAKTADPTK